MAQGQDTLQSEAQPATIASRIWVALLRRSRTTTPRKRDIDVRSADDGLAELVRQLAELLVQLAELVCLGRRGRRRGEIALVGALPCGHGARLHRRTGSPRRAASCRPGPGSGWKRPADEDKEGRLEG